uniref:Uncharacterized protein n=1 Tax=Arundo donax TaxID=35708 RepID=A0A0A9EDG7_ARUDO
MKSTLFRLTVFGGNFMIGSPLIRVSFVRRRRTILNTVCSFLYPRTAFLAIGCFIIVQNELYVEYGSYFRKRK